MEVGGGQQMERGEREPATVMVKLGDPEKAARRGGGKWDFVSHTDIPPVVYYISIFLP